MDYLKTKTLPRGTKIEVMGKTLFLDGDVKVTGHHLDVDGIWFVFPEENKTNVGEAQLTGFRAPDIHKDKVG